MASKLGLLGRSCVVVFLLALCCALLAASPRKGKQDLRPVVIAQISDSHIGLKRSSKTNRPIDTRAQLARVVELVNERHPDAVIVSGDIGETPEAWQDARRILSHLTAPVYFLPGNHDENGHNLERYREAFGRDFYKFRVGFAEFYAIDSQLLGNFENFSAKPLPPMTPEAEAASEQMFAWLAQEGSHRPPKEVRVRIAVQHIPFSRGPAGQDLAPDPKPYWSIPEPYRSREMEALQRLGIHDVLEGHWHSQLIFQADGFTHHIAPATSWATAGPLGFALHTISPEGAVQTEFVPLQ
jgi:3',5'-cyclic AMP phosphodiesterase CpdA